MNSRLRTHNTQLKVLITAGPTREPMDPVRYLTNSSSGAMGFALAAAFQKKKSRVTVICGPTNFPAPKKIRVVPVVTARDMQRQVKKYLKQTDLFIATAAVCDFRFEKISAGKLKKGSASYWTVRLARNPDILLEVGRWKKKTGAPIKLVGFALETGKIPQAMATKMREKNLDLIIGNTPASFAEESITPLWLERGGKIRRYQRMSKTALANKISQWALTLPSPRGRGEKYESLLPVFGRRWPKAG